METLLNKLKSEYKNIVFVEGARFSWSPKKNEVIYKVNNDVSTEINDWSLLHEVGHALLDHDDYETDFELLQLEVEAWQEARTVADKFEIKINPDHIEDCLDTYRDWLYQRSSCPNCTSSSLQSDSKTYQCFNCGISWQVSSSRLCRAYRRKQKEALV